MTMQIADRFVLNRETYHLIGGQGGPLASPEYFAMKAVMLSTACYRGYHALYVFEGLDLVVREFTLRAEGGIYHSINGVTAAGVPGQGHYLGLNLIIPFTGTLRLARGFLAELDHLRPYPVAFERVLDLTLDHGRLVATHDRSEDVAELRRRRQAGETTDTDLN